MSNVEIETAPPPHRPRAAPVKLAVVGTFLIFAACTGWLVLRGLTVRVPEAVMITRASPAWEGSIASVDGINLPRPTTAVFDKRSKYSLSFHLTPGDYTLTVKRGTQQLAYYPFKLSKRENRAVFYLPDTPGEGAPTTQPYTPFDVNFALPGE